MKDKSKTTQRPSADKAKLFSEPVYYFHADEDFREDWNWKKKEVVDHNANDPRATTSKNKVAG